MWKCLGVRAMSFPLHLTVELMVVPINNVVHNLICVFEVTFPPALYARIGNIVETFPTLAILNCKLHNVNLDIFYNHKTENVYTVLVVTNVAHCCLHIFYLL